MIEELNNCIKFKCFILIVYLVDLFGDSVVSLWMMELSLALPEEWRLVGRVSGCLSDDARFL